MGLLEPNKPSTLPVWAGQPSGLCTEVQLANNLNSRQVEGPAFPDGLRGKELGMGLQGQRGEALGIVLLSPRV